MKIILLGNVKNLGLEGDVVEVSEGYARNFLFPQHLAIEASDATLRKKKEVESNAKRKESKQLQKNRKDSANVDGREIIIAVKTDGDSLYGAVSEKDIVKALKEDGIEIKKQQVSFTPAKEVGTYEAVVSFDGGFEAKVTVIIESIK